MMADSSRVYKISKEDVHLLLQEDYKIECKADLVTV